MGELKVGSIVEHIHCEGALTVKMVQGNEVVVCSETMHLGVYNRDKLFLIPGQDYNYLRRIVLDTMSDVAKEIGTSALSSERGRLAVARKLYEKDVRRGTDMIAHAQQQIHQCVIGAIDSDAVAAVMRQNFKRREMPLAGVSMEKDPAKMLTHTDISGHSEVLVQQLTDDELALMCCDVADMLANGMGFTADMSYLDTSLFAGLSDLQRRITYWTKARGNVRKSQVWSMAQKVVGHCRMAEVDDAIENVLEAIRQQEDCDD